MGGNGGSPNRDAASATSADGPTADSAPMPPPPPPGSEPPPPACKKTTPVANSGDLMAAITAAQPGDCLVLADGNYTFPSITKTGTEVEPIVIRAANRGRAIVNAGALHFLNSAYVVLEGFDVTTPGVATTLYNAGSNGMIVSFMDSHHCRLTRSRLHRWDRWRRGTGSSSWGRAPTTTGSITTTSDR
jgi:hypothetical protein